MANFNKRTLVIIGVFLGILLIIGGAIIITVKVRNSSKEDTEKGKRLVVKIDTNQPTPAGASTPDPKITPTGQQSAPEDIKDSGSPKTPDPEVKPTEAPKPQNSGEVPKPPTGGKGEPAPEPQPTGGVQPESAKVTAQGAVDENKSKWTTEGTPDTDTRNVGQGDAQPKAQGTDKIPTPVSPVIAALDEYGELFRAALEEQDRIERMYIEGKITEQEGLEMQNDLQKNLSEKRAKLKSEYGSIITDGMVDATVQRHRAEYRKAKAQTAVNENKGNWTNGDVKVKPLTDAQLAEIAAQQNSRQINIDGKRYTDMGNGKLKGDDGIVGHLVGLALLLVIAGLFYLEGWPRIH